MTDSIARFVCDQGYALSYVVCTDIAQLMGCAQHALSGGALRMFAETTVASLLMGTRLKGRGSLSMQFQSESGQVRTLRCDAMGMGYMRGLADVRADVHASASDALFEHGRLSVAKQIEGSKQPFQSHVMIDHDHVTRAVNTFLRESEQVQAMILSEVCIEDEQIVGARGMYFERLPDAKAEQQRPLDTLFDEMWDGAHEHMSFAAADTGAERSATAVIDGIFGASVFEQLRTYDVQFHCPCARERYVASIKQFPMKEITSMCNEAGIMECTCEFCRTTYDIHLDDVI